MTTGDKEWPDRELLVKKKCSVRGQYLDGVIYIYNHHIYMYVCNVYMVYL